MIVGFVRVYCQKVQKKKKNVDEKENKKKNQNTVQETWIFSSSLYTFI